MTGELIIHGCLILLLIYCAGLLLGRMHRVEREKEGNESWGWSKSTDEKD